ncbi:MAG: DUF4304 domain-containing protein [Bacteroidetes bacterium]|nr:DUF4304 domain-containing protein [Bacteroidota bacterium]
MNEVKLQNIRQMLSVFFVSHGFVQAKNIWLKENEDTIIVIELRKFTWSKSFSIDFGIIIKGLLGTQDKQPSGFDCHLESSLIGLIDDASIREKLIYWACDYSDISIDEAQEKIDFIIKYFLHFKILDYLNDRATLIGVKKHIITNSHYTKLQIRKFTAEQLLQFCERNEQ